MSVVAAAFALLVAVLVTGLWVLSLARGAVPELVTEPRAIRLHILAEFGMAALLAVGGILELAGHGAGEPILLLGFGAVLYSIVNSSGHYAERRQRAPLVMFAILFGLTLGITIGLLLN